MLLNLLKIELLKTKRSLSFLMMLACPLMVVVLQSLVLAKTGSQSIDERGWSLLWVGATSIWSYFMLPLYIALVTALLNGNEHKNATWRFMLSMPISQTQLYTVKAFLAWLYVIAANIALLIWVALSILIFQAVGFADTTQANESAFAYPMFIQVAKTSIACLPILIIQHAVSWRFGNIVVPLVLGVIATMGIIQVGSSEYWVYYPWSYITMANLASEVANQTTALYIATSVAAVIAMATTYWLSNREVYS